MEKNKKWKWKLAVAMHCNLRPSDVVPLVVLGFNYEAYNVYEPTNSSIPRPLRTDNAPT